MSLLKRLRAIKNKMSDRLLSDNHIIEVDLREIFEARKGKPSETKIYN